MVDHELHDIWPESRTLTTVLPEAGWLFRYLMASALLITFLVSGPLLAHSRAQEGGPLTEPMGTYGAQSWRIPIFADESDRSVLLDATLFRPAGKGPFPLIIISHGAALDAPSHGPWDYRPEAAIRWFIAKGYAVAVPIRRGYGRSGGERVSIGSCSTPDYVRAGEEVAADILGVLKYLRNQPFIVSNRVVLVGHSVGAAGSLVAASHNPPGLAGVIAFAPGAGNIGPHQVCREDLLVDAFKKFGASNHLPTLWIYASNDTYFWPELAGRLFGAYVSDNPSLHEFVMLLPSGDRGHGLFLRTDTPALWSPPVNSFLDRVLR